MWRNAHGKLGRRTPRYRYRSSDEAIAYSASKYAAVSAIRALEDACWVAKLRALEKIRFPLKTMGAARPMTEVRSTASIHSGAGRSQLTAAELWLCLVI